MRAALILFACTLAAHAQWQILDAHTTADLRGIDNVGKGVVWASGTHGTVLRSEDNGTNWQHCTVPPGAEQLDFRGIQAFDANTAIVMSSGKGDLSRLYKTTDGCVTWKLVFTNPDKDGFWDDIRFASEKHGYLLGDPVSESFQLWQTANGGDTWDQTIRFGDNLLHADPVTQGAFAASNSVLWAIDGSSGSYLAIGSGGIAGARLYWVSRFRTASGSGGSGGQNRVPIGRKSESSGIFSLGFLIDNPLVGVAVGGDYTQPNDFAGTAAQTSAGEANWRPSQTMPHGYRSAVAYNATTKTWITVGPNGTDISTDDGRNWRALKPGAGDAPDADQRWNALSLPFVVGPKGRIGMLRSDALSATGAAISQPKAKP